MAIATESGYGAFLPKSQNEFIDREVLRGQMVKQASYLTEMDRVYAQLDEMARQFDITVRRLGEEFAGTQEYRYAELDERARQFDEQIHLDWYGARTQREAAESAADLAEAQQELEEERWDWSQEQYENLQSQQDYASSDYGGNSYVSGEDYSDELAWLYEDEDTSWSEGIYSSGSSGYSGQVSIYDEYGNLSPESTPFG